MVIITGISVLSGAASLKEDLQTNTKARGKNLATSRESATAPQAEGHLLTATTVVQCPNSGGRVQVKQRSCTNCGNTGKHCMHIMYTCYITGSCNPAVSAELGQTYALLSCFVVLLLTPYVLFCLC